MNIDLNNFFLLLREMLGSSMFLFILGVLVTISTLMLIGKFVLDPSYKRNAADAKKYYERIHICENKINNLQREKDKLEEEIENLKKENVLLKKEIEELKKNKQFAFPCIA